MASYTTSLRLIQPATGEYPGSWGTQANNGLTALVDTSVAGTATITMVAADYTLSTANGATDEARAAVLSLGGTPGGSYNVIVPAVSKLYVVYNNTGAAQTVKTSAGTGVSVPNGAAAYLRCDGTNVVTAVNYFGSLTVGTVTGGTFVSPSLTGTPTAPTAAGGTSTTQIATTAFVATGFAPLASPAFTGTPTAPTAAAGTSTTQLATTAFVTATSFSSVLPGQTGNAGKYITTDGTNASWADVYPSLTGNAGKILETDGASVSWQQKYPTQTGNSGKFLSTDGTNASWSDVYPSQTSNAGKFLTTNGTTASWEIVPGQSGTTASGSVTLTASSAGAQSITPTTWGQSVTLPDATTCVLGAELFNIKNESTYDLKILNFAGTCIGFIRPYCTASVGLANKSTSAGTWTLEGTEIIGVTANTSFTSSYNTATNTHSRYISIDNNRDLLLFGSGGGTGVFGIVYNKATLTWGASTLIRSSAYFSFWQAIKTGTDQALFVSTNNGTALEAVVLSISGTTITVNTAATATVSANPANTTWDSNFITIVGSSIVIAIPTNTPAVVIRAMTISGTTVTIGSETTLPGTSSQGVYVYTASSTVLLTLSQITGTIYARTYTISGTTITSANITNLTTTSIVYSAAALGSAWALVYINSQTYGAILTISGTTPTFSTALIGNQTSNSIYFGSSKVVVSSSAGFSGSSFSVNTFSNNAGAISAGTAVNFSTDVTNSNFSDYWAISPTLIGATLGARIYTINISGLNPVITLSSQVPNQFGSGASGLLYKTGYLSIKLGDNVAAFSTYSVINIGGIARQGQVAYPSAAITMSVSSSDRYVFGTNSFNASLGGVIQRVEVAQ